MSIPQEAIERAIEGGYKKGHIWGLEDGIYILRDDRGQRYGSLSIEQIALDPTFWQALGRALGWWITRKSEIDASSRERAHEFYDLILTGGDTKAFWDELLKV